MSGMEQPSVGVRPGGGCWFQNPRNGDEVRFSLNNLAFVSGVVDEAVWSCWRRLRLAGEWREGTSPLPLS